MRGQRGRYHLTLPYYRVGQLPRRKQRVLYRGGAFIQQRK